MNAYKLAKNISLDNCHLNHADRKDIATMLRQQANRIAELEKGLEDYSGEVDDGVKFVGTLPDGHPLKMSKPVAWIGETLMGRQYINGSNGFLPVGTALYTHPVKQLSDESLMDIIVETGCVLYDFNQAKEFARAIIKEITE